MLIASIALHLLFAGGAAFWVVAHYTAGRKLTFQAGPKSPNPSEQALRHRVQMERKAQTQTVPAAVPKRVLTTGLAKVALPPMPEMPTVPNAPTTPMRAAASSTSFASNNSLGASSLGGTGSGAAINFFGIRDVSSSVVIMIDVSDSMFGRTGDADYKTHKLVKLGKEQSFQAVRDEAIKLVQSLTPQTRFGIVRWSGGAYPWKPELVQATDENKAAAIEHIQNDVDYHKAPKKPDRPGGTRHDYAMEEAFKLKPETIYMLTDGNATGVTPEQIFQLTDEAQKALPKKARLHAIYYLTGADKADERQMLMTLAARNGGQFRSVQAQGRKTR
ncbi:MAG: VWA domain-containing protein [Chthoniobacterales bacterium]